MSTKSTAHIIIPTYKPTEALTAAVKAALGQEQAAVIVTVVDDSTPGGVDQYVDAFFDDERFRYIRLARNSGPSDARNIGLLVGAGADFVTFHDDDDLPKPDKIAHQLCQLSAPREMDPVRMDTIAGDLPETYDIAVNKVIRREREGKTHITGEMIYLVRDILPNSYNFFGVSGRPYSLHYPSALFRKRVFQALGGFCPSLYGYEDNELAVRTMLGGINHHFSETPLYYFNKNNASITYNPDSEQSQRVRSVYERIQNMRRDSGLRPGDFTQKYRQPVSACPGIEKTHNLSSGDIDESIPADDKVIGEIREALRNEIDN